MLALGQPPSLAQGLKNFMRLMSVAMVRWPGDLARRRSAQSLTTLPSILLSPCQPGYIGMEAGKTFLQSQAMMTPSTWIILVLLPIHGALCALLTLYTSLGVYGAALAQISTYYLFGLSIAGWVWRSKARDCWGGFSVRALTEGKGTFCALWLPGICSYSLEWLSFEVVALLAGRLGETAVAAQAGLASLDGFLFMLPYAISGARPHRVVQPKR
jgi:MATE family multidrug resistance protein